MISCKKEYTGGQRALGHVEFLFGANSSCSSGHSGVRRECPGGEATCRIVYVPRFGADYTRPLVQGTTPVVLDTLGTGHYEGTAPASAGPPAEIADQVRRAAGEG